MRTLLLSIVLASTSCGGAGGDPAGHGHDHGTEASKSDPHHVAENRTRCEDDVALSAETLVRYGIAVEPARELPLVPRITAPGHLAFPQGSVARIGSAVTGRVVELRVRSGDLVTRGDTLLVLDSPALGEAQIDYLQKRAVANTAGPSVELARDALERAKELHERSQGISLSEVRKREAELKAAERDRDIAQAAETAASNGLLLLGMDEPGIQTLQATGKVAPRVEIRSPIDGNIVEVSVTQGELVGPDKDRLLVVGDLETLWAIAEVSETMLPEVEIGAAASVRIPALGLAGLEGRVAAFPTVLEAATRTAEVRIQVPNPDRRMLPGMFLQVEIESSRGAGTPILAVPDGAVLTIEGRTSVFVPVEPGASVFCMHEVEVGPPVGTYIPVLSGLKAGELVVVAGTFRLKAEHGKASAQHEH